MDKKILSERIYTKFNNIIIKLENMSEDIKKCGRSEKNKTDLLNNIDSLIAEVKTKIYLAETYVSTIGKDRKEDVEDSLNKAFIDIEAMVRAAEYAQNSVFKNEGEENEEEESDFDKCKEKLRNFWENYSDIKLSLIDNEKKVKQEMYEDIVKRIYNNFIIDGDDCFEISLNNNYIIEVIDIIIKDFPFFEYTKNIIDGRIVSLYVYPIKTTK